MTEAAKELIDRMQALLDNKSFNNPYYKSRFDEQQDIQIKILEIKHKENK